MTAFRNHLLRTLGPEVVRRLELKPIALSPDHKIELPGRYIDDLLFLEQGVAAVMIPFCNGERATILLAGSESVLGSCTMTGSPRGNHQVFLLDSGKGLLSNKTAALLEFKRGEHFHDRVLRYQQLHFLLTAQIAGCNACHSLEQRLSRWLLESKYRNGEGALPLSHENLAGQLSASRSSVTLLASQFRTKGFIQYTRGRLRVVNTAGLEAISCECYEVIRNHIEEYIKS